MSPKKKTTDPNALLVKKRTIGTRTFVEFTCPNSDTAEDVIQHVADDFNVVREKEQG